MGPNKMILSDINSMTEDFDEAKVVHEKIETNRETHDLFFDKEWILLA